MFDLEHSLSPWICLSYCLHISKPRGSKSFKKLVKTGVNEGMLRRWGGERADVVEEGEYEEKEEIHGGWCWWCPVTLIFRTVVTCGSDIT